MYVCDVTGFSPRIFNGAGHDWHLRLPTSTVFYLPIINKSVAAQATASIRKAVVLLVEIDCDRLYSVGINVTCCVGQIASQILRGGAEMPVFKLISILVFFLLVSGGQILLLVDWAYAGCCNCWKPRQPCIPCGCFLRAEVLLEQTSGQTVGNEITIITKNSGNNYRVEASEDVIREILDLRKHGKIPYGDYMFKASGSADNFKLKCVGFVPIDPEEEKKNPDKWPDLNLQRWVDQFEKEHPKMEKK